ncbi:MAG TPA: TlpA disulfide reductase family protein [bacterium]|nr:TlpA disulfide reductase family protein [bacterium]
MRKLTLSVAAAAVALILAAGCGGGGGTLGNPAVDFEASGLDGKMYKLSDYFDDLVFLNFFASWCEPCRVEVPGMLRLAKEYEGKPFQLIYVTEDTAPALAQGMVDDLGISVPVLLAAEEPFASNEEANRFYAHQAIPVTFIIARGDLVEVLVGSQMEETFRAKIEANLPK